MRVLQLNCGDAAFHTLHDRLLDAQSGSLRHVPRLSFHFCNRFDPQSCPGLPSAEVCSRLKALRISNKRHWAVSGDRFYKEPVEASPEVARAMREQVRSCLSVRLDLSHDSVQRSPPLSPLVYALRQLVLEWRLSAGGTWEEAVLGNVAQAGVKRRPLPLQDSFPHLVALDLNVGAHRLFDVCHAPSSSLLSLTTQLRDDPDTDTGVPRQLLLSPSLVALRVLEEGWFNVRALQVLPQLAHLQHITCHVTNNLDLFSYLAACTSLTSIDLTWNEDVVTPTIAESRLLCSMSGLKELSIGGNPGGEWERLRVDEANRLFSLAPLPFSCRALEHLDVCIYTVQPQVLAAFYRSMCDAVLNGRASASHPLFPSLRTLVLAQSDYGEEDDLDGVDEQTRWEGCAPWSTRASLVELLDADRAVTFPRLQYMQVLGIRVADDPFIGRDVVQRWRTKWPHVQTARLERHLDPLVEQRWLGRWRRQNGLSDPNVPVGANSF